MSRAGGDELAGTATDGAVVLRFATFELDLADEELRRAGVRVRLAGKPFRLLVLLATSSGRLVRREVIRRHLWAADSYGEFDQGINTLVREVRRALGDRAVSPRFVATEPRRGYRFVAPVETVRRRPTAPPPAAERGQRPLLHAGLDRLLGVAVPLLVAGGLLAALSHFSSRSRKAVPFPVQPPG